jgi:hypothetical protein
MPSILEPRRRIGQALYAVVMEAYVAGVSTRSVDDLVAALGGDSGISKSEVSRICAGLDEIVGAFRTRTLDHVEFPYVHFDATSLHVRNTASQVTSMAVVVATSITADGSSEVLGCFARNLLALVPRSHTDMVAAGEEVVARPDQAELVAFGVGEHDVALVGRLPDVDVPTAQLDQPGGRISLTVDRGGRQVEVDPVLAGLPLRDGLEEDPEFGAIGRHQAQLTVGCFVERPVQRLGSEPRETGRIVRVEAQGDQPRRHGLVVLARSKVSSTQRICATATIVSQPSSTMPT